MLGALKGATARLYHSGFSEAMELSLIDKQVVGLLSERAVGLRLIRKMRAWPVPESAAVYESQGLRCRREPVRVADADGVPKKQAAAPCAPSTCIHSCCSAQKSATPPADQTPPWQLTRRSRPRRIRFLRWLPPSLGLRQLIGAHLIGRIHRDSINARITQPHNPHRAIDAVVAASETHP